MFGPNFPLQDRFLKEFFACPYGDNFYLTGGTALARFYLFHRESVDLDFFTHNQNVDFSQLNRIVLSLANKLGLKVSQQVLAESFLQYIFVDKEGNNLKTDFVKDIVVRFGEIVIKNGVRLDSLENIAVNKILAVFGRTEAKDFIDLYFLLTDKKFALKDLIAKAKKKDLGLTEFYLANSIGQSEKLEKLPKMLIPFDLNKMKKFYEKTHQKILREIKPRV